MNIESLLVTLPIMLKGMLGIFTVTAVILISVYLLNKLTSRNGGDSGNDQN